MLQAGRNGRSLLVWAVIFLAAVKIGDLVIGRWFMGNLYVVGPYAVKARRSILLQEFQPNLDVTITPDEAFLKGSDLQRRPFRVRTDADGFIIGPDEADGPVDIVFAGGSTTECLFLDEEVRFPYLVSKRLTRTADGTRVRTLNAGKSSSNQVHFSLVILGKVLKYKPRAVVLMESINDLGLLMESGSYWRAPRSRAIVQDPDGTGESSSVLRSGARTVKNLLAPNAWILFRVGVLSRILPGETDEFEEFRGHHEEVFTLDAAAHDFRAALTANVSLLNAWGIRPVLMTQFNRFDARDEDTHSRFDESPQPPLSWNEFVAAYQTFNEIVREVARANTVTLVDLDRLVPKTKENMVDSFHLSATGSKLVADLIAQQMALLPDGYKLNQ